MAEMKVRFAVGPQSGPVPGHDLLECAQALEETGFDGIWLSDLPVSPVLDPLLGLALIAGRTRRLRLGANVVALGRNPYLLAKELAQLDHVSNGRLLLSFVTGIGGSTERQALALGGAGRGEVLEETLGLLRTWWAGGAVSHRSARWSFAGLASGTPPLQDPLEVWLGGRGPRSLERVGRIADGWLGAQLTPSESHAARERIQQAAEQAGREIDPEHFGLSIPYARWRPDPEVLSGLRARRPDLDPLAVLPVGKEALRSLIGQYIAAGLSKFVVRPACGVQSWSEESRWLADAILDLQT